MSSFTIKIASPERFKPDIPGYQYPKGVNHEREHYAVYIFTTYQNKILSLLKDISYIDPNMARWSIDPETGIQTNTCRIWNPDVLKKSEVHTYGNGPDPYFHLLKDIIQLIKEEEYGKIAMRSDLVSIFNNNSGYGNIHI